MGGVKARRRGGNKVAQVMDVLNRSHASIQSCSDIVDEGDEADEGEQPMKLTLPVKGDGQ